MKNLMTYKDYKARIEFDPRDDIFTGKTEGISDSITFHGETVQEVKADFEAAVDHYIEDRRFQPGDYRRGYARSFFANSVSIMSGN